LSVKLIAFDLDGTLVDAYAAITRTFNYVMKSVGYPPQDALTIRRAVGLGDKQLLAAFVEKKDLDKALVLYRKHHAVDLKRYAKLLPGARRVLSLLKKKGYRLAVASNRPTRFSQIIIRHLDIKKYFNYVLCADKIKRGKPSPIILRRIMRKLGVTAAQTVYVGDMAIDAQTGRNAGVKTIIVTGGSSRLSEIKKEQPWRIISGIASFAELFNDAHGLRR
jgi:HAD superfamily hydrolase (TIGR01549 family)